MTTEAFTVTLLSELLRRVNLSSSVPAAVQSVFEGAYAAEVDHFRFTRMHWRPTTTRFWIPDAFFGGPGNTVDLTSVGKALVAGETLFVNLYLIGVTKFARAGNRKFARYSAELAGCESEHRVLAETLLNAAPPNNVGFEIYADRDLGWDRERARAGGRRLRRPGRCPRSVLRARTSDHDPAGHDRRQQPDVALDRLARGPSQPWRPANASHGPSPPWRPADAPPLLVEGWRSHPFLREHRA